ncbi:MAG: patatin-like phospholipase family protein [Paludibacteraceae bacterium]|nr:patatin-like phospholipase family protein [Paludibacteraceae bacterium]
METKRPDVALVLSSGSSRGLAAIGAIESLQSHGFKITSVAGCSMGAIVGGMFAAGKLPELKDWYEQMTLRKMLSLSDFKPRLNYLLGGEKIMQALAELIPGVQIEDLEIPLALIASDMNTGEEVVFREGDLSHAIRASFSLPLILEPVQDGNRLLMDGGITNALPLNRVARKTGDILVSVNVSARERPDLKAVMSKNSRFASLMNRVNDIMIQQHCELMKQLCPPDINIDVAMNQFGMFEFDHADKIINYGRHLMDKAIEKFDKKA